MADGGMQGPGEGGWQGIGNGEHLRIQWISHAIKAFPRAKTPKVAETTPVVVWTKVLSGHDLMAHVPQDIAQERTPFGVRAVPHILQTAGLCSHSKLIPTAILLPSHNKHT